MSWYIFEVYETLTFSKSKKFHLQILMQETITQRYSEIFYGQIQGKTLGKARLKKTLVNLPFGCERFMFLTKLSADQTENEHENNKQAKY